MFDAALTEVYLSEHFPGHTIQLRKLEATQDYGVVLDGAALRTRVNMNGYLERKHELDVQEEITAMLSECIQHELSKSQEGRTGD